MDYGARFYDAAVGRFWGVDPISDKFPHVTTYNYAENEPIRNIDLWGLQQYDMISRDPGLDAIDATKEERQHYQDYANIAFGGSAAVTAIGGAAVEAGVITFGLETSKTVIATNVLADGMVQTISNITEGLNPVTNYDAVGGLTSTLAGPIVSNAVDGFVDIKGSSENIISFNSPDEAAANTIIGGGLGKAFGGVVESIQKNVGNLAAGAANYISGLFTESSKQVAGQAIKENKERK